MGISHIPKQEHADAHQHRQSYIPVFCHPYLHKPVQSYNFSLKSPKNSTENTDTSYSPRFAVVKLKKPCFNPSAVHDTVRAEGIWLLWIIICAKPLKAGMPNSWQSFSFG